MNKNGEVKDLFSWNALQGILYLFGSLIFLFVASFSSILNALVETEQERVELRSIGAIVRGNLSQFVGSLEGQDGSATIATLVFWSAAGALLYIIFWAGINAVSEFYNNSAVASTFVHSQSFEKSNHWSEYISRTMFRFFSIVLLVAYGLTFIELLVPTWSQLFSFAVGSLSSFSGVGSLLLATIGSVLSLHVFSVILRLIVMRTRVFSNKVS